MDLQEKCALTRIESKNPRTESENFSAEQKTTSIGSCEKLVLTSMPPYSIPQRGERLVDIG